MPISARVIPIDNGIMTTSTIHQPRGRFLFPVLLIAIMGAIFGVQASLIDVPAIRAIATQQR